MNPFVLKKTNCDHIYFKIIYFSSLLFMFKKTTKFLNENQVYKTTQQHLSYLQLTTV